MKKTLKADAPVFKPSGIPMPVEYPDGYGIDGTDSGAMITEYFFVEAPTTDYRRILPHGHITWSGGICNVSYTSRLNVKIGTVTTQTEWNAVKADSGPIFNGMCKCLWG